jgi:drug/metabolite transporter (DMT)-like permease
LQTNSSLNNVILPGILLSLAGTFMFSLKPIVVKYAYEIGLTSEQVITLRMMFALPFYIGVVILCWIKNSDKRRAYIANILPTALLGVLGYFVASYLDLLGLQFISAQLERIVLFCFPIIVVLLSYFVFKTKLPKNIWWMLGISYTGILLIFAHDLRVMGSNVALGTSLVFLSAIAFAVYVIYSKPIMTKIGSQMFTSIAMIAASITILVFFVFTQNIKTLHVSNHAFLVVAGFAFFCTVIPSLLVAEAIHKIGPELTSIVGTCGPVITSIFAVILLDEAFTIYHAAGLTLILVAVGMMMKPKIK